MLVRRLARSSVHELGQVAELELDRGAHAMPFTTRALADDRLPCSTPPWWLLARSSTNRFPKIELLLAVMRLSILSDLPRAPREYSPA